MMHITSTLTLGKSLAIKREKGDDGEVTRAHLKFTDLFLHRDQVNALCGQRGGWSETSFFDEYDAPLGLWTLVLHESAWSLAGAIDRPNGEGLRLTDATAVLSAVELTFTPLGALAAGQITWLVAGNEAGDIEPLLGRECHADLHLSGGEQIDMLKGPAA
jgi:hypothetical protein